LERTFILDYAADIDAKDLADELTSLPYFEIVKVNNRVQLLYGGTKKYLPGDLLSEQWNFDNPLNDDADIDPLKHGKWRKGIRMLLS
jgi:hypothetical protein